jgi:hypothetical protein
MTNPPTMYGVNVEFRDASVGQAVRAWIPPERGWV